jgi:hypothetical protein
MTKDPAKGQPLYVPPEERVTVDQIKQRVEQIQDLALTQSKQVVRDVYEKDVTRAALVALGVVVVAASLAYYLGTRVARQVAAPTAE